MSGPLVEQAGVIGACWYVEPTRFESQADEFARRVLGERTRLSRWVAMKPRSTGAMSQQWLTCDGEFLDISAYACAAREMPNNLPIYLVFNDTLLSRRPRNLIARKSAAVAGSVAVAPMAAAAGEVHPSTDLLLLDPHNPTRSHISTFCTLMNTEGFAIFRKLLESLPANTSQPSVLRWLEERITSYPALRPLLHIHLDSPDNPWSWQSRRLSSRDPSLLYRKAVTVTFEYIFTVELLRVGIALPINRGFFYRLRSRLGRLG